MSAFKQKKPYKMDNYVTVGDVEKLKQKVENKQLYEACKKCLNLLCSTNYNLDCNTGHRTTKKDFYPKAMDMIAELKDVIKSYEDNGGI